MKNFPWLVLCVFILAACSLPQSSPTPVPPPMDTLAPSATVTEPATVLPTSSPTPLATDTPAATDTSAAPTATSLTDLLRGGPMFALLGGMDQYSNPVGTPLKVWHKFPIMSQATTGQEYSGGVYSYWASVSLKQAVSFYSGKLPGLGFSNSTLASGYGGTGDKADHSSTFMLSGAVIYIFTYDNKPNNTLVIISSP
jgi:hypothetical protein